MIETVLTLPNPEKLVAWLERAVRPAMTPDVSNYAKGRLRVWLGLEPALLAPFHTKPGLEVSEGVVRRLKDMIDWDYDFCLVTYSGDDKPIGISPHRDAGYSDFEAVNLHLSGECRFDYWRDWIGYGSTTAGRKNHKIDRDAGEVTIGGKPVEPDDVVLFVPGQVTRFNSKNPHAAPRRVLVAGT